MGSNITGQPERDSQALEADLYTIGRLAEDIKRQGISASSWGKRFWLIATSNFEFANHRVLVRA